MSSKINLTTKVDTVRVGRAARKISISKLHWIFATTFKIGNIIKSYFLLPPHTRKSDTSYLFAAPLVFAGLLGAILISLRICVARVLSFCSSFTVPGALSVPWSDIFSTINLEIKTFKCSLKGLEGYRQDQRNFWTTRKGRYSVPISNTAGVHKMDASSKVLICFVLGRILWPRLYKSENRMFKILSGWTFDKGRVSQNLKKLGKNSTGMGLKSIEYRM